MNFNKQGECAWFKYSRNSTDQKSHQGRSAYNEKHSGISSGVQWQLDDGLFAGVGFSYDSLKQDGDDYVSDGYSMKFGGVLKKEYGDTTMAITAHTGFYRHETSRYFAHIGEGAVAESMPFGISLATEARVWHTVYRERQFIKPYLGLHLNSIWQDGYTETGATAYNLTVDSAHHFTAQLRPGIEFGTQVGANGSELFGRAGVNLLLSGDEIETNSRFANAPADSSKLELTSDADRYTAEFSIGTNLVLSDRMTVSLNADVKTSAYTQTYGGMAKLRYSF